ncbi:Protein of unknown function [Bacillus thuringiensis]|uniref:Uncharacterized protein n=1 Tax=Bacillus thuringiensis TaxID=1428 RepID=A0A1C4DW68_BACTU|nr:Protein of unknown function [Bacillus thuringiensis]
MSWIVRLKVYDVEKE